MYNSHRKQEIMIWGQFYICLALKNNYVVETIVQYVLRVQLLPL